MICGPETAFVARNESEGTVAQIAQSKRIIKSILCRATGMWFRIVQVNSVQLGSFCSI